jgi:3-oxoacyl-(acyl-carrier-protein) synthase
MRAALADAALSETDIGLVHLSANGCPLTDEPEAEALGQVFGNVPKVRYARVKDLLGENPSSGAAQLALAAADLRDAPALGAALVNGFGAGGNFMSVVLTAV